MNYKSQLRIWAVEQAVKAMGGKAVDFKSVKEFAEELVEYAYSAPVDFTGLAQDVLKVANEEEVDSTLIQKLISELELAEEQSLIRKKAKLAAVQ